MAKILFVDDESDMEILAKQKFRKEVSRGEFELYFAQNGQEALDLIQNEPNISVVVSDVNMPEMDGLTLLDHLKDVNPLIRTLVVSAYGDTKTLRSAMNKGAYDFVTKPIDFKELGDVIQRTLEVCKTTSETSLHSYQLLLASSFPERFDLKSTQDEKTLLWDGFLSDPVHMVVLGVSFEASMLPIEISVSVAHGVIKAALLDDSELSLEDLEKKLLRISSFLKAEILVAHIDLKAYTVTYKMKGNFKAYHLVQGEKKFWTTAETALLNLGDMIIFEGSSSSSLSFTRFD